MFPKNVNNVQKMSLMDKNSKKLGPQNVSEDYQNWNNSNFLIAQIEPNWLPLFTRKYY